MGSLHSWPVLLVLSLDNWFALFMLLRACKRVMTRDRCVPSMSLITYQLGTNSEYFHTSPIVVLEQY